MAKILLVEDELDLAKLVENWFVREHHLVEVAHDGITAIHQLRVSKFDVIILDLMLPGLSGVEVCKQYREALGTSPILMLTAKTTLGDKEIGFEAGADDYLTKPFELKELDLRVRALLRRGEGIQTSVIKIRDIEIDTGSHVVKKKGKEIHLLPKEFRLLEYFARHPHRVFGSEELLDSVWESDSEAHNDTVRGHITRLRKKLDTPGKSSLITTVYGIGYKLEVSDDNQA